jgi:hypothetical protein
MREMNPIIPAGSQTMPQRTMPFPGAVKVNVICREPMHLVLHPPFDTASLDVKNFQNAAMDMRFQAGNPGAGNQCVTDQRQLGNEPVFSFINFAHDGMVHRSKKNGGRF